MSTEQEVLAQAKREGEAFTEFANQVSRLLDDLPSPQEIENGYYVHSLFILLFNFLSRAEICHWCAMRDGARILHDGVRPMDCSVEIEGRWKIWHEVKARHAEINQRVMENVNAGAMPYATETEAEEHMALSLVSLYNHYNLDLFKITNKALQLIEALNKAHGGN